jgi:CDP-glucose 4,6-dehydratase
MENPLGQSLRELPGPLLLTGHTGFKGTWMTFLLENLNVPVVGYSLPPEKDSLFDRAERTGAIPEVFADIRDYETLEKFIEEKKPSTIIHMAAQPLVLKSYKNPRETFDVNVMGTVNILDISFKKDFVKTIVVVTTDKVYRNDNSGRAFVETDPLEGKDPYSASKVGTEAVVAAWQQISKVSGGPIVVSGRAGNVIGGGDFAQDRLIPDIIRGLISENRIEIRNSDSTRPWQHVLDPLVGYIQIIEARLRGSILDSVNFGPDATEFSVKDLVEVGSSIFPELRNLLVFKEISKVSTEAGKLHISSNLGKENLNWKPRWTSKQSIQLAFKWWKDFIESSTDPKLLCSRDIQEYFS